MPAVHRGPLVGFAGGSALLGALAGTVGLGGVGWVAGVVCLVVLDVGLAHGLGGRVLGRRHLGPADRVTLTRATLACGVAALTADSFVGSATVPALVTLVALTVVALVLDAVDGRVARRTGTVSALGARFDMEVDAFLILVLSVYVAPAAGWWVLAIGLARYAYLAAGPVLPWMRGSLPPRYWRKVVAAVQGIVLVVTAADVLPRAWSRLALLVALAMLAESFGRDVVWVWRHPSVAPVPSRHPVARWFSLLAGLLGWFALVGPSEGGRLSPGAFVRIPVEVLLVLGLLLVLPAGARLVTAVLAGFVLGLLAVLEILDLGFVSALGRPFDPVTDWGYLGSATALVDDSFGFGGMVASSIGAVALVAGVLVGLPLSALHLARLLHRHRRRSIRVVTALGVAWVVCAVLGVQVVAGTPVASSRAAGVAVDHVSQVWAGVVDQRVFAGAVAADAFRDTPADELLTGLRGKDVLFVFVESYGRVALEDPSISAGVGAVLDAGTKRLRAAGYSSRSAFLTSPTFGGISWLAHSTLQSGLWVDDQQRYDSLLGGDRMTLSGAFEKAGWRTVADVPSNHQSWPQGRSFYRYDTVYGAGDVGYAGPSFSYATMPDQYVLKAFQRLELEASPRPPVMAEIDLVSSHAPWAPLPRLVDWDAVGDGSVFAPMPAQGQSPDAVLRDPHRVRAAYGQSIEYSLDTLVSFVERYGSDDLVLVLLGDHQPATVVSGAAAGHDVPVTVIAHDPAVTGRIGGWGWQDGLRPTPGAPVWPMDAFRDRFLTAYGPGGVPAEASGARVPGAD